jgi:hypothetical protein
MSQAMPDKAPLIVTVPMWIILALNIILNLSGAWLIVSYLLNTKTPNFNSVLLTLVSAIGTVVLRRWAAIVFVLLTVIGMLPLFAGRLNGPGLALNFLSCVVVLLAFRWMR